MQLVKIIRQKLQVKKKNSKKPRDVADGKGQLHEFQELQDNQKVPFLH